MLSGIAPEYGFCSLKKRISLIWAWQWADLVNIWSWGLCVVGVVGEVGLR